MFSSNVSEQLLKEHEGQHSKYWAEPYISCISPGFPVKKLKQFKSRDSSHPYILLNCRDQLEPLTFRRANPE